MKKFANLTDFAAHMSKLMTSENVALQRALERCAQAVEQAAREEIANLQQEMSQGSGRESIGYRVDGLTATIGSNESDIVAQEHGAPGNAPRPLLENALLRNREIIQMNLARAAVQGLLKGSGESMNE